MQKSQGYIMESVCRTKKLSTVKNRWLFFSKKVRDI